MKRMKSIAFGILKRGLPVFAWLAAAAPAFAQMDARLSGEDKGILQWVVALGIVILMAAIAFMNPKRSHLD